MVSTTGSSRESKIENFLINYNIQYEPQKRFKTCRITKPLPFDFYLPKYRKAIEYQGQQHYKVTRFGNISYERAKLEFDKLQITDKIKGTKVI